MFNIQIEYVSGKKKNRNGFTKREEVALKYRIAQNIMLEAEADEEFAAEVETTEGFMEELHMRYIDLEEMLEQANRLEGGWWSKFLYRISPV